MWGVTLTIYLCLMLLACIAGGLASIEPFDSSGQCYFNSEDTSAMTRVAFIDSSGQCRSSIDETESSKANDKRCGPAMEAMGLEKSSMQSAGYCVLDNGIMRDSGDGSRCEILPTNGAFFDNFFNCSDLNGRLFDSVNGKAGAVLSEISEDKESGRCVLTFKDDPSEEDMRGYMEFLSLNAECQGSEFL